jgi:tRNA(Ser,Leu) C12 N-acetylase TAN1
MVMVKPNKESPKPKKASPKPKKPSPKPKKASPKPKKASPKQKKASPKPKKASPKPKKESSKPKKESSKPKKASPKQKKASPKQKKPSPKPIYNTNTNNKNTNTNNKNTNTNNKNTNTNTNNKNTNTNNKNGRNSINNNKIYKRKHNKFDFKVNSIKTFIYSIGVGFILQLFFNKKLIHIFIDNENITHISNNFKDILLKELKIPSILSDMFIGVDDTFINNENKTQLTDDITTEIGSLLDIKKNLFDPSFFDIKLSFGLNHITLYIKNKIKLFDVTLIEDTEPFELILTLSNIDATSDWDTYKDNLLTQITSKNDAINSLIIKKINEIISTVIHKNKSIINDNIKVIIDEIDNILTITIPFGFNTLSESIKDDIKTSIKTAIISMLETFVNSFTTLKIPETTIISIDNLIDNMDIHETRTEKLELLHEQLKKDIIDMLITTLQAQFTTYMTTNPIDLGTFIPIEDKTIDNTDLPENSAIEELISNEITEPESFIGNLIKLRNNNNKIYSKFQNTSVPVNILKIIKIIKISLTSLLSVFVLLKLFAEPYVGNNILYKLVKGLFNLIFILCFTIISLIFIILNSTEMVNNIIKLSMGGNTNNNEITNNINELANNINTPTNNSDEFNIENIINTIIYKIGNFIKVSAAPILFIIGTVIYMLFNLYISGFIFILLGGCIVAGSIIGKDSALISIIPKLLIYGIVTIITGILFIISNFINNKK